MTVIVIGWDGLDYDYVHRFGLVDEFGIVNNRLETITNPTLDKPHTFEIWPSIITGLEPDEHGIHAEDYTDSGEFENSLLNFAASVSNYTVPERVRWAVGRWLRSAGAKFAFENLNYYDEHNLWTIFDGRSAFPLAVPNARSEYDDALGIESDRGAQLSSYLDVETGDDGITVHRPSVDLDTLSTRLGADVGCKMGAISETMQWDFDLVFVWLSYLDTLGHVAPTVDDTRQWMRDGYETASRWTKYIHEQLSDDDALLCVSDHGLKDGTHTEDAFFGRWCHEPTTMPNHVCDVAETIDSIAPKSNRRGTPYMPSEKQEDFDAVNERLEQLGYLN